MSMAFEMAYVRLEVEATLATVATGVVPNHPLHLNFYRPETNSYVYMIHPKLSILKFC